MSNIKERIRAIIVDKLSVGAEEITEEKSFTDLGADSLDAVELIMEFEKEFKIDIPDEEMEQIKSVGHAMEMVIQKVNEKSQSIQ